MDKEYVILKMEDVILEIGRMIHIKGKEFIFILTVKDIKVI
jgi:hypothetical protein